MSTLQRSIAAALIAVVTAQTAALAGPEPILKTHLGHTSGMVPPGWENVGNRDDAMALFEKLKANWSLRLTHDNTSDLSRFAVTIHLQLRELTGRFVRNGDQYLMTYTLWSEQDQLPHPFVIHNTKGSFILAPGPEQWYGLQSMEMTAVVGRLGVEPRNDDDANNENDNGDGNGDDQADGNIFRIGFGIKSDKQAQEQLKENMPVEHAHDVRFHIDEFFTFLLASDKPIELWAGNDQPGVVLLICKGEKNWHGMTLHPDARRPEFPVSRNETRDRLDVRSGFRIAIATDPASVNVHAGLGRVDRAMLDQAGLSMRELTGLRFMALFRQVFSAVQRVFSVRGYEPSEQRRAIFKKLHDLQQAGADPS